MNKINIGTVSYQISCEQVVRGKLIVSRLYIVRLHAIEVSLP